MVNKQYAKALIHQLTTRPVCLDDEGNIDIFTDEKQMIEIIVKFLDKYQKKLIGKK